jgi:hypothetical protein
MRNPRGFHEFLFTSFEQARALMPKSPVKRRCKGLARGRKEAGHDQTQPTDSPLDHFASIRWIAVMRPRESDFAKDQEAAPVDMLAALFEARGWDCVVLSEDEFQGEVQGSWAKYQLRAIWRAADNVLQFLCLPDIRVGDEKRQQAYELLSFVNEQMWLGHFDIWSNGDVLLYRHGALLGDEGTLSLDQAQALVENAIDECDRFYPAFQFVLWGDKSPRDALDAAMVDVGGEA